MAIKAKRAQETVRDSAAVLSAANQIYPIGWIIIETSAGEDKFKMADGVTPYNSLGYGNGTPGEGGESLPANLALGTRTATGIPITNSNGTGVTLPVATNALAGLASATDKAKLDGIAAGATVNSTDASLKDRANHTGTQSSSTITDFTEAVQDAVAALLAAGANVTLNYNDGGNTLTIGAAAGGGGGESADPETIRDTIGAALIGLGNISVLVNDAADTITITTTATANDTDANLKNRANHTGQQPATTITEDATHRFTTDTEKATWNGSAASAIASLRNGVPTAGDDLNKIYTALQTLNAIVTGTTPDGDSFVNTIQETLAILANYPEGVNLVLALAGKIETSAIINTLTETTAGKVLDARQGKALMDAITAKVVNNLSSSNSIAPTKDAVIAALALKLNIAPTLGTSTVLTFVAPNIQGTPAAPLTGNVTANTTNAVVGVVVQLVHNQGTIPTFDPTKFKKLSGSGDYKVGQINYIFCEYMSATEILYTIQQRA